MFTGIIQNKGTIKQIQSQKGQTRLSIEFNTKPAKSITLGESIAVNGVCLTVVRTNGKNFEADVMKPTLTATNLGRLKKGSQVNLEKSLKYGDEIGGHFVTGHVDAVGKIVAITKNKNNYEIEIAAPENVMKLIAVKGSITVDGISLTVQHCTDKTFNIGIIPHTLKMTTLAEKKKGDRVNLEVDLTARYIQSILKQIKPAAKSGKFKEAFLKKQGF